MGHAQQGKVKVALGKSWQTLGEVKDGQHGVAALGKAWQALGEVAGWATWSGGARQSVADSCGGGG